MNKIPQDPVMLLSFVNMQLRDNYSDLNDFCLSFNMEESFIKEKMQIIDYSYDDKTNQFI